MSHYRLFGYDLFLFSGNLDFTAILIDDLAQSLFMKYYSNQTLFPWQLKENYFLYTELTLQH